MVTDQPTPEKSIEHLIAKVPALEVKFDVPTIEQVHVNDEVFQHPTDEAHSVAGVIGLMSGMMLLHDVAADTMHDVDDLVGHLKRQKREDDEDEEDEE
jgi:hypothetical protein